MSEENVPRGTKAELISTFGDRLRFVIWLAALRLGLWSGKEFAAHVGKRETQISRWLREDPKPGWDIIKLLAGVVDVLPTWLDDPRVNGAVEPELFAEWIGARRRQLGLAVDTGQPLKSIKALKRKDLPRLVAERHASVYGPKKKRT